MTEVLVLPVPEALAALYLVPAAMSHHDAECLADAAVAAHVAEPLRRLTRSLIGTSGLAVAIRPLADFGVLAPDVPQDAGELEVIAFASRTGPLPGPVHEWVTRAAAASLAAELDLPLLDCFAKTTIEAGEALATLPGAAELAGIAGAFRLADWAVVEHAGTALITSGLRRFGVPELMVDQVPADLRAPWTMMLLAAGAKVLEYLRRELRHGESGPFFELPGTLGVGRGDISTAYGVGLQDDGALLPVRLGLEPVVAGTLASYLSVGTPEGLDTAEHRTAVRHLLPLLSRQADGGQLPGRAPSAPATGGAPRGRRNRPAAAARTRTGAARAQRRS